ncbi:unnamed protein product [Somion occarium]|uniref:RNA-dependent RNA polymerase n=1 Tax=Somion occarium TaxID=3059160 RepID=A0ABP1CGR1_9APHY
MNTIAVSRTNSMSSTSTISSASSTTSTRIRQERVDANRPVQPYPRRTASSAPRIPSSRPGQTPSPTDTETSSGWSKVSNSDDSDEDFELESYIVSDDEDLITDVSFQRPRRICTRFYVPSAARKRPLDGLESPPSGSTGLTPKLQRISVQTNNGTSTSLRMQALNSPPNVPLLRSNTAPNQEGLRPSRDIIQSKSTSYPGPIHDPESPFNDPSTSRPSQLGTYVIAHDDLVQSQMDRHKLAWGVQYEIARGVSNRRWTWKEVTLDKIRQLQGDNTKACEVPAIILGKQFTGAPAHEQKLWLELDREQKALEENQHRGLGLQGLEEPDDDWHGAKRWYGGRIQQTVELMKTSDKELQVQVQPMEMRKSSRFARFLGSRRMISLKLPAFYERANEVLRQKFILCGRVFLPFCVKDNGAYLMETDEDYHGRRPFEQGDQRRCSLQSFIGWHNPLELNGKQAASKWVARFDLGLSTSIPALKFEPSNIFHQEDEKIGDEIFTDGCGYMNASALVCIAKNLGYSQIPCAVQGRILGSKGLWTIHPTERDPRDPPKIWIRPSQVKVRLTAQWDVKHLSKLHPAHLIFDLVQPSRVSAPSRLSRYPIMNMSHNHVPTEIFSKLMEDSLNELVEPFTNWKGENAMVLLWYMIYKSGNMTTVRLQRHAAGLARVLGLSRQFLDLPSDQDLLIEDLEDPEEETEKETPEGDLSLAPPDSLYESALELLQAGFTPSDCGFLLDKIRQILKQVLKSFLKEFRIVVPESAEALIIPDPHGVLKEGEIHFKSSKGLKDATMNFDPNQLFGEVLLYRNPCRLPSDIQKAKAISHPKLADYVDVIILPVKGKCSLASLLAGGDTAVCIYNQQLVQSFQPPSVNNILPPDLQRENFLPQDGTLQVSGLSREIQHLSADEAQSYLQDQLLSGYINSKVGMYSKFHDNAAYAFGYGADCTVRLAHIFNLVLDSRKSGLIIQKDVYSKDCKDFNRMLPQCMSLDKEEKVGDSLRHLPRRLKEPFVLDELLAEGEKVQTECLQAFDHLSEDCRRTADPDLLRPWRSACEARNEHSAIRQELSSIEQQVQRLREQWSSVWGDNNRQKQIATPKKGKGRNKKNSRNKGLDCLVDSFRKPPEGVVLLSHLRQVEVLKASYAYSLKDRFAFAVAFKTLCSIKADSCGSTAFTKQFAETMAMPSSAYRVFSLEQRG